MNTLVLSRCRLPNNQVSAFSVRFTCARQPKVVRQALPRHKKQVFRLLGFYDSYHMLRFRCYERLRKQILEYLEGCHV